MRLPDHLARSYLRYNDDGEIIIDWVKEHYNVYEARRKKVPSRGKSSSHDPGSHGHPQGYTNDIATIYDILLAVRVIAISEAVTAVPVHIADAFARVLNQRTTLYTWFKSNAHQRDIETRQTNERHLHPIRVLRNAIEILDDKLPKPKRNETQQKPKASLSQAVIEPKTSNLFETLNSIEEVTEAESAGCAQPEDKSGTVEQHVVHLQQDRKPTTEDILLEEYYMARYCLMRELEALEDFLVVEFTRWSLCPKVDNMLGPLVIAAVNSADQMDKAMRANFDSFDQLEDAFLRGLGCHALQNIEHERYLRTWAIINTVLRQEDPYYLDDESIRTASPLAQGPSACTAFETTYFQAVFDAEELHPAKTIAICYWIL